MWVYVKVTVSKIFTD